MKRICKFITIPTTLFDTPDLSLSAKWCLLALDSITPQCGWVGVGVQGLSSLTNLPSKTVKEALTELHEHGAIEVSMQDGQKLIKPLIYKDAYPKVGERIVVGDKPSDVSPLPYDEIADKWAESCPHLPPIARWSPQSKNKLRSAMKNAGLNLEQLYKCFKIVGATQFLNGTGEFQASFRWLTSKSDNLEKVYTGFYSRSYAEKSDYEQIMKGGEVNQQSQSDDYYR